MLSLRHEESTRWLEDGTLRLPVLDFELVRNQYAGAVFLLASGASAATFPFERYRAYPFIAMNGSIVRCVEEGISPLFYLCDDTSFVEGRSDLAILGAKQAQNIAMSYEVMRDIHARDADALSAARIYLLERVNRYYDRPPLSDRQFAWKNRNDPDLLCDFSLLRKKANRIGFSRNMRRGHYCSRTIAYTAIQLAYHLGFHEVFVIGMDLRRDAGRFYEQGQQTALPTSLDEDYDDYILPSFRLMADKVCASDRFTVYNLSPVSRVPESVIPKITEEQLEKRLLR